MPGMVSRRCFLRGEPRSTAAVSPSGDSPSGNLVAELGGACISMQGVACRLCGDPCEPRAIRFRLMTGGRALPEIDVAACTGCSVCVTACPVGALTMVQPARG